MDEDGRRWTADFGPFLTLGLQLALTVVVFFFIGRWLDQRLDTAPWLMIGGAALGITGGLIHFIKTVLAIGRKQDQEHRTGKGSSRGED